MTRKALGIMAMSVAMFLSMAAGAQTYYAPLYNNNGNQIGTVGLPQPTIWDQLDASNKARNDWYSQRQQLRQQQTQQGLPASSPICNPLLESCP